MKHKSDIDLMKGLNEGCEKSFEEIYQRYWLSMYSAVLKRTQDKDIAEEIVQSIFLKVWFRRDKITIQETFGAYFATAVKYQVINYYDKIKHRQNYLTWLTNNSQGAHHNIEEYLNHRSLEEFIEKTVQLLPERCQIVFRLRVNEGLSQREIAEELVISEKTVEAHLSKARRYLRKALVSSGVLESLLIFLKL